MLVIQVIPVILMTTVNQIKPVIPMTTVNQIKPVIPAKAGIHLFH